MERKKISMMSNRPNTIQTQNLTTGREDEQSTMMSGGNAHLKYQLVDRKQKKDTSGPSYQSMAVERTQRNSS